MWVYSGGGPVGFIGVGDLYGAIGGGEGVGDDDHALDVGVVGALFYLR